MKKEEAFEHYHAIQEYCRERKGRCSRCAFAYKQDNLYNYKYLCGLGQCVASQPYDVGEVVGCSVKWWRWKEAKK